MENIGKRCTHKKNYCVIIIYKQGKSNQFARKIIYTTNLIENLNGKIRKYTKSKLSFSSDDTVKKTVYLSPMEIEKKWTLPIYNWGLIMNQFMLMFENRIQI